MDLRELPHATQRRHPWEMARLNYFSSVLPRRFGAHQSSYSHLDVGAGDAWLVSSFRKLHCAISRSVAWDIGYENSAVRRRIGKQVRAVELTPTQPSGGFDLITLLDVLEHVEEPEAFLHSIVDENLNADGYALISVPAWGALYSQHDVVLGHYRRYDPKAARALLKGAHLKIVSCGGLFHTLLGPRVLQVLQERLAPKKTRTNDAMAWEHEKLVTGTIMAVLGCDAALSRLFSRLGLDVPGLSWWALCQKQV